MSLSVFMYVISETDYILKRVFNKVEEYYYCRIFGSTQRTYVYKGILVDNKLIFNKDGVHYEISIEKMEALECRVLVNE